MVVSAWRFRLYLAGTGAPIAPSDGRPDLTPLEGVLSSITRSRAPPERIWHALALWWRLDCRRRALEAEEIG
jgi:hypothetical protein